MKTKGTPPLITQCRHVSEASLQSGAKPFPDTTHSLTVPISVHYTTEQELQVKECICDTASSEGRSNTLAATIFAIKNRNILAPNTASLSAAAGGSAYLHTPIVKEDITSQPALGTATWRNEQTSNASRHSQETRWRIMGQFEKTLLERVGGTQPLQDMRHGVRPAILTWLLDDLAHLRVPRVSEFNL